MKCLRLASVAALISAATVSAGPLRIREDDGFCPKGYTMSVYYKTIYASATSVQSTVASSTTAAVLSQTTAAPAVTTSTTSIVVESTTSAPVVQIETTTSSAPAAETTAAETEIKKTAPAVVIPPTSLATLPVEPTAVPVVKAPVVKAPVVDAPVVDAPEKTTTKAIVEAPSTSTKSSTSSSSTKSASTSPSEGSPGKATFYGGNVGGGTCSFSGYTLPSHLFGAALSLQRWDDAANCGACVSVTGPNGNSIKAMIVDQCPECESNHLDLFQDAFAELSDISAGIIQTSWSYVSCDLDGPLKLKNKEGTSAYWFSMQVVNANEPVASLDVSTDGGSTWQGTSRQYYNFFENSAGFGTSTVDVRITGASGKTVVVKNVGVGSGNVVTANSNL
ncbi:Barwin-related endoglucanase [Penicillium concentricum]|uniref:Barwin-related endoglucanase n=1 Tax=Penicillium concentricum TaxID=293559 RepID=A0A9W9RIX2_9EURO|nr:Barwin-related endoglucanase [Penicillium concentricum]KAJ5360390.1 Barwin-related endoglucanase [Penicillium concentricum]